MPPLLLKTLENRPPNPRKTRYEKVSCVFATNGGLRIALPAFSVSNANPRCVFIVGLNHPLRSQIDNSFTAS